MGTAPHARHAGTCLEKDPAPAAVHLAICLSHKRPWPTLEGRKGMSPVLSLHLSPTWCRSQGHTGHDPGEPGCRAHCPAPTPAGSAASAGRHFPLQSSLQKERTSFKQKPNKSLLSYF